MHFSFFYIFYFFVNDVDGCQKILGYDPDAAFDRFVSQTGRKARETGLAPTGQLYRASTDKCHFLAQGAAPKMRKMRPRLTFF